MLLLSPVDQSLLATVSVEQRSLGASFGAYAFGARRIEVNDNLSDPAVVAAVLTHELVHVRQLDTHNFGPPGCGGSEIPAYQAQARFWLALYGPQGREDEDTSGVAEMNTRAQAESRGEIPAYVASVYRAFCP